MDILGWIALIEYLSLTLISALVTYIFYMSNIYKPNFMIKSTGFLLASLTLCCLAIFLMRFATAFNIGFIHSIKNPLLMIPRGLMLISLINFLDKAMKKTK